MKTLKLLILSLIMAPLMSQASNINTPEFDEAVKELITVEVPSCMEFFHEPEMYSKGESYETDDGLAAWCLNYIIKNRDWYEKFSAYND